MSLEDSLSVPTRLNLALPLPSPRGLIHPLPPVLDRRAICNNFYAGKISRLVCGHEIVPFILFGSHIEGILLFILISGMIYCYHLKNEFPVQQNVRNCLILIGWVLTVWNILVWFYCLYCHQYSPPPVLIIVGPTAYFVLVYAHGPSIWWFICDNNCRGCQ